MQHHFVVYYIHFSALLKQLSGAYRENRAFYVKLGINAPPVGLVFELYITMNNGVIFYCDDDDDDLMMFTDIIRQIDPQLECITANDCEDALHMLSTESLVPDLIFLDINMPKMSGIELLAWLKRYHALQEVPIIMYSTSLNKRETDYCAELGASVVIPKLYSLDDSVKQLKETIAQHLSDKQKK